MPIDGEIWHHIGHVERALDSGWIDAVSYHPQFERRADDEGLADETLLPSDQLALGVEAGADIVQEHRAVAAALHDRLRGSRPDG